MASKYGYCFAQKAAGDVTGIIDYLAEELGNPGAAASFKKNLGECIGTLRQFPQSGSLVRNRCLWKQGIRKKMIGEYVLFYFPDDKKQMVEILRVIYGRRDMDVALKGVSN